MRKTGLSTIWDGNRALATSGKRGKRQTTTSTHAPTKTASPHDDPALLQTYWASSSVIVCSYTAQSFCPYFPGTCQASQLRRNGCLKNIFKPPPATSSSAALRTHISSIAMRSPRDVMRSLYFSIGGCIFEAIWSDDARKAHGRKTQKRQAKARAEEHVSWNARLASHHRTEESSVNHRTLTNVSTQQQSPLFSKMPPELRRLIYTFAFGGEQLRLGIGCDREKIGPFKLSCLEAQRLLISTRSCKLLCVNPFSINQPGYLRVGIALTQT
jgi:hypothetical protein